MSATPIDLVMDAGTPVTAFTTKDDMKAFGLQNGADYHDYVAGDGE
jgi:hypothetical protein